MGCMTITPEQDQIITVDKRGRTYLSALATRERYIGVVDEAGVITLTPAVVMTESQRYLLEHPEIMETVNRARDRLANGERPARGRA